VKPSDESFDNIARWLSITLTADQRTLLSRYGQWLEKEAGPAGGIGPSESPRLWDRHIADSLAFVTGIPVDTRTLVDVGGGVGLPSIPIAIARPDLVCTLIDRSEKRARLAQRAVRILGMMNLNIEHTDVDLVHDTFDVATFRASLRIPEAALITKRLIPAGGVGLFAVSRLREAPSLPKAPDGISFMLSSEGAMVLDTPFWLLRMQRS
jgi:16S rRNA (guanine527-N7)-methyltransferase